MNDLRLRSKQKRRLPECPPQIAGHAIIIGKMGRPDNFVAGPRYEQCDTEGARPRVDIASYHGAPERNLTGRSAFGGLPPPRDIAGGP